MNRPFIVVIDDDPEVLNKLKEDMKYFEDRFNILYYNSPFLALKELEKYKKEKIALFLVDKTMAEMSGENFLQKIEEQFSEAKMVLLSTYSEKEDTMNVFKEMSIDCFIIKPYSPPEEKLYPPLEDLLKAWQSVTTTNNKEEEIKIIGHKWARDIHGIKNFLSRNILPYRFLDIESNNEAREIVSNLGLKQVPRLLVILPDGTQLINPQITELAEKIGLNTSPSHKFYDLVIIGGGPSGLAASVYAASEGLSVLVVERQAPGGQAGWSTNIANYLGFPGGISGEELSKRAITQATKFGVEFLSASMVTDIKLNGKYKTVIVNDSDKVSCHVVLICTGASYRHLNAQGLDKFTGAGVFYEAVNTETTSCSGKDVFVVGGGNSAGQAAMYLAEVANKVKLLVREDSLKDYMSQYLIEQIESHPDIEIMTNTTIQEAKGDKMLQRIVLKNNVTGEVIEKDAAAVFVYIGADPCTAWLPEMIVKDEKGYIITGTDLIIDNKKPATWGLERYPALMETSVPGIFAAGDVRSASVKRVASAVGEGAVAVSLIHQYIASV